MTHSWLPSSLAELADVIGLDATLKLADEWGGTRRYFPAHAPDGHWLVECIGREAADKLCAHLCVGLNNDMGLEISLPLGPKGSFNAIRRRLRAALEQGMTAAEAARYAGMTERSAYNHRVRMKQQSNSPQMTLFAPPLALELKSDRPMDILRQPETDPLALKKN